MSLDNWKAAILPKVDGSRNLCNVLGDKTDFLVFLSSFVSIIGSPEQANYAAGGKPIEVYRAQVIPRLWLPQETAVEGYQVQSWGEDRLFSHLQQRGNHEEEKTDETNKTLNHKALLQGASSWGQVENIVLDALLLKIARMLSIEVSNLETSKPLHAYGIDSLTAVELRSWLMKELGAEVSVFDITNNSSISQLAVIAAKKSSLTPDVRGD
ncbi:beta-ketoacyl synthase domain-containing protein [Colletotrichum tofieldiae]|nr:beta-ketoacyl synthase domain-containing protein [Colletotrichum tofieldiae]